MSRNGNLRFPGPNVPSRYIKRLDDAEPPWLPNSEFRLLELECTSWYESLPMSLQFTTSAIYLRKETEQLGNLCLLHCMHHQTACDLYRVGAPALYKLRDAFCFPAEQQGFLRYVQDTLFGHAKALASIMYETSRHGTRMLADTWLPTIIYDSSRIMLWHLMQPIDTTMKDPVVLLSETIPHLHKNVDLLRKMQALHAVAQPLRIAAEKMLDKARIEGEVDWQIIIPGDPYNYEDSGDADEPSPLGTPTQTAPDYKLNPLSIYRMARKHIPEKHAPERFSIGTPGTGLLSISGPSSVHSSANYPSPDLDAELETLLTSDIGWMWQNTNQPSSTVVEPLTFAAENSHPTLPLTSGPLDSEINGVNLFFQQ